jgi:NADPH-dependent curcumin reductase CurA
LRFGRCFEKAIAAFFGGEDAGPDRPEQVMQRSGAAGAVGLEAVQDAEAVQYFYEPFLE